LAMRHFKKACENDRVPQADLKTPVKVDMRLAKWGT
jgi:hypothetical protein